MKNKIIMIMLSALLLCGCDSETETIKVLNPNYTERFVTLEEYFYGDVVVDTRTGVEYWLSGGANNSGTLTVLVDADGKPLICEEYREK